MKAPLKSLFASFALGAKTLPPTVNVCANGSSSSASIICGCGLNVPLILNVLLFVVKVIVSAHSSTVPKAEYSVSAVMTPNF